MSSDAESKEELLVSIWGASSGMNSTEAMVARGKESKRTVAGTAASADSADLESKAECSSQAVEECKQKSVQHGAKQNDLRD